MGYLQNIKAEDTGLKVGEKYTLIYCNSGAMTIKTEITLKAIIPGDSYAQYNNILKIALIEKGKRKEQGLILKESMLFFKGWDLGLMVDTDFNSFSMNALINFVGDKDKIKESIEKLNVYTKTKKGIISYTDKDNLHNNKILYPEKADLNHAVVNRIMTAI